MEHPIGEVLRRQGRKQTWLARQIDYSERHTNQVIRGALPALPEFRRKCAETLGLPESELFTPEPASVAS